MAPGLILAQAIGRWGNYFNQELFGYPTDSAWGIPISLTNRPIEFLNNDFFQPVFLYESLGNLIIFCFLIFVHYLIIKKRINFKNNYYPFVSYLFFYSLLRFLLEFIRLDRTYIIFNLRFPQIVSLLIVIFSIIFVLLKNKKYVKV
jgi:phosphatidylglycerol:prolipoprotein diacylglycerol transferase